MDMGLTGIKWLDIIIMLVLSSGLLGMAWVFLLSRAGVQKALAQHEWLKALEPILGAAINKAEAWGRDNAAKGPAKLDHAVSVVMQGMATIGIPEKFKHEELIRAMIESKLTGGSLSDIADSVLSNLTKSE